MKQLDAARQAARAQEKSSAHAAEVADSSFRIGRGIEVGWFFRRTGSGELVSGSVVEDPSQYEGRPDLAVVRFAVARAKRQKVQPSATGWWRRRERIHNR